MLIIDSDKKDDKKWVNLPSKAYKDKEGETKYSYVVFFDKDRSEAFIKACLEALKKFESTLAQEDHGFSNVGEVKGNFSDF